MYQSTIDKINILLTQDKTLSAEQREILVEAKNKLIKSSSIDQAIKVVRLLASAIGAFT